MEQIDRNGSLVGDDFDGGEKFSGTSHYWKTGRVGTVYPTFVDANDIIENSDLTEGSKNQEKEKILLLGNTSALYLLIYFIQNY